MKLACLGVFMRLDRSLMSSYLRTSGFWPRVRARALRAPVIWSHCHARRGAARPPPHLSQLRCFYLSPKAFHQFQLDRQGRISFHWAKLHPAELHCTLLSYAAPSWAPLHPNELHCTLLRYPVPLRYAAFNWVTHHPIWAKLRPKSYAAISELSLALLSYTAPLWAMLHPTELCLTLNELRGTLKNLMFPAHRSFADPYDKIMVFRENPAKIPVWQKIH